MLTKIKDRIRNAIRDVAFWTMVAITFALLGVSSVIAVAAWVTEWAHEWLQENYWDRPPIDRSDS